MGSRLNMTTVLGVAKVHASNKITLPKDVRAELEIIDGDYVKFIQEGGKIVIRKVQP